MKIADITELTGTTKAAIYRWMEKHPKLNFAHEDTLTGHPFPKPIRKEGREVVWDDDTVIAWWNDNAQVIGRHSGETLSTTIPWTSFRKVMLIPPEIDVNEETGEETVYDDMELVERYRREGKNVRLWFKDVSDAVFFKLKHF